LKNQHSQRGKQQPGKKTRGKRKTKSGLKSRSDRGERGVKVESSVGKRKGVDPPGTSGEKGGKLGGLPHKEKELTPFSVG